MEKSNGTNQKLFFCVLKNLSNRKSQNLTTAKTKDYSIKDNNIVMK